LFNAQRHAFAVDISAPEGDNLAGAYPNVRGPNTSMIGTTCLWNDFVFLLSSLQ
jgi:hypothetical protein